MLNVPVRSVLRAIVRMIFPFEASRTSATRTDFLDATLTTRASPGAYVRWAGQVIFTAAWAGVATSSGVTAATRTIRRMSRVCQLSGALDRNVKRAALDRHRIARRAVVDDRDGERLARDVGLELAGGVEQVVVAPERQGD